MLVTSLVLTKVPGGNNLRQGSSLARLKRVGPGGAPCRKMDGEGELLHVVVSRKGGGECEQTEEEPWLVASHPKGSRTSQNSTSTVCGQVFKSGAREEQM